MTTLLAKALAAPRAKYRTVYQDSSFAEHLEVAVAYAEGRISGSQAAAVINGTRQNIHQRIGGILLKAYKMGLIIQRDGSGYDNRPLD
jgi:hypothetical protein